MIDWIMSTGNTMRKTAATTEEAHRVGNPPSASRVVVPVSAAQPSPMTMNRRVVHQKDAVVRSFVNSAANVLRNID